VASWASPTQRGTRAFDGIEQGLANSKRNEPFTWTIHMPGAHRAQQNGAIPSIRSGNAPCIVR
jgi:hypothetical protein